MLAPSAVILCWFVIYPLVQTIWLGQARCNAQGQACVANGWDQYVDVARSPEFRNAVGVTVRFALITVPAGLILGLGLAALADKYLRGMAVFRTVFSSTVATSVAVSSLIWRFLLEPSTGVLPNLGLFSSLFPVSKDPGLLRDPGTALWAVALTSIWSGLGFTFILITAGLQSVPRELHEAAVVDGASGVRRFWRITVPMLSPMLIFVVIVLTTRAFQAYGEIDLLTQGGPVPGYETTTLTYLTFGSRSIILGDVGLQAAVSVLLFVVLLVLSILQLTFLGRRVHHG